MKSKTISALVILIPFLLNVAQSQEFEKVEFPEEFPDIQEWQLVNIRGADIDSSGYIDAYFYVYILPSPDTTRYKFLYAPPMVLVFYNIHPDTTEKTFQIIPRLIIYMPGPNLPNKPNRFALRERDGSWKQEQSPNNTNLKIDFDFENPKFVIGGRGLLYFIYIKKVDGKLEFLIGDERKSLEPNTDDKKKNTE